MAPAQKLYALNGPAALPQALQAKILRIGVIQAGKILEEKLVRHRESVTIGASPRNTIVVPASSLPRSFVLFEMQQGHYSLKFSDSMDGRVSVQDQVLSLEQIRQQGLALPRGGNLLALPLNESSRGKVLLGEVTLLFQFVTPPPVQPRPQLPPSVRGGIWVNMDWTLAASFLTVLVLNFGFVLYLRTVDFPREVEPDVIADDVIGYLPTVKQPQSLDLGKLAEAGEKAIEKVKQAGPKSGGKGKRSKPGPTRPCDQACQEARAAQRRADLARAVGSMGLLRMIGSKGSAGGEVADLIGRGDPGTDADTVFSHVGGLTVSGRGSRGGLRVKGGSGSGKAVGIDDLAGRVGGPGRVDTEGMVRERVPPADVKQRPAEIIDGTMSADGVAQVLRRGMAAVRTCYQRALKRNPDLAGKITIRMSVSPMGKVTKVSIEGDTIGDATVAYCIESYASRWRFPPPEDGRPAEVAAPFVLQAAK